MIKKEIFGFIGTFFLVAIAIGSGIEDGTLVNDGTTMFDPGLTYTDHTPDGSEIIISRSRYMEQVQGFWLAQCIANWTGLVTEMDRVGPPFYTDDDWGEADKRNIWGHYGPSPNGMIEYVFVREGDTWYSDDDTDIEYMYQHLLDLHDKSVLSPEQIRNGWLRHIHSNESAPNGENYLWESNEVAYYLMLDGVVPPATSEPANNPKYKMIDAQLTTEIFGLFSPARPDIALNMAHLPIRTTAKDDAEWAAKFYVVMYSLASYVESGLSMREKVFWLAERARDILPAGSFVAGMYDHIRANYDHNPDKTDWESTRDDIYSVYQKGSADGYVYDQPFDAGINFASSLVSLFYGEGDLPRTIRIGTLAGWDSDNPTATWGGLLGFLLGRDGVEKVFNEYDLSDTYWIHRTRRNFPDRTPDIDGEDTFRSMSERCIYIIDRVVMEEMGGGVDIKKDVWYIPDKGTAY